VLTNKEKRYLKALGGKLEPVVQIGKAGVAPAVVAGAAGVIAGRELIKVRVLKNSPVEPAEAIAELAAGTGAELVQVIGRNGLLFKRNIEKPKIIFPAGGTAAPAAAPPPAPAAAPAAKAAKAAGAKPRGGAKHAGRPPRPDEDRPAAAKPRGMAKPAAGKAFAPRPKSAERFADRPPRPVGKRPAAPAGPKGPAAPAGRAFGPKARGAAAPATEKAFGFKPRGAGKPLPGLKKDGREKNAYQADPGRGQTDRRQGGYKYVDPQHRQAKPAGDRKAGARTVGSGQPRKTDTAGHVGRGGRGHGPAGTKRKT
jgi:RNA-binding protein